MSRRETDPRSVPLDFTCQEGLKITGLPEAEWAPLSEIRVNMKLFRELCDFAGMGMLNIEFKDLERDSVPEVSGFRLNQDGTASAVGTVVSRVRAKNEQTLQSGCYKFCRQVSARIELDRNDFLLEMNTLRDPNEWVRRLNQMLKRALLTEGVRHLLMPASKAENLRQHVRMVGLSGMVVSSVLVPQLMLGVDQPVGLNFMLGTYVTSALGYRIFDAHHCQNNAQCNGAYRRNGLSVMGMELGRAVEFATNVSFADFFHLAEGGEDNQ